MGSVDHTIYRDYIVNRRFFLFTVVWPVALSLAKTSLQRRNPFDTQVFRVKELTLPHPFLNYFSRVICI